MSNDHDVQDWFDRSIEELPHQPFTLSVMQQVQRSERHQRLLRSVALLVAGSSLCLLLPELIVPFNMLATLPLAVIDVGGEQWPLLMLILAAGLAGWFVNHARNAGFIRSGLLGFF
jgi:hypothetical protein